jgi:hypothetical protein
MDSFGIELEDLIKRWEQIGNDALIAGLQSQIQKLQCPTDAPSDAPTGVAQSR